LCCHNKQYGGAGTAAESLPLRAVCLPACLRASFVSRCASSARKIRPLEKKLGRKPATPQNHKKKLQHILVPIVKIRPQLGYLELGRFLGR
jgi:hypothetical protein